MKTLKIGILLICLNLVSTVSAVSIDDNNCSNILEILNSDYSCGITISGSNYYNMTLKGYTCQTGYTWKFDKENNLATCQDCRTFTIDNSNKAPNGIYTGACANGKYKLSDCKTGYTLRDGACEKEAQGYSQTAGGSKSDRTINGDVYLGRAFGIGKLKVNGNIYKINNNSIPCVTIGTDVRDLTYSNYSMPSITFPTSGTLESGTYNGNIILGKIEANESSDTNRYYATFTINGNLYYYDTARGCK